MPTETKKITILGKEYTIYIIHDRYSKEYKEQRMGICYGRCKAYTAEIYILAKELFDCEIDDVNKELGFNNTLRHEIIHAFFHECGLKWNSSSASSWADNEEMVDWMAYQIPKISKVFEELSIME